MVAPVLDSSDIQSHLKIFAKNIRGLGNKIDELVLHWVQNPPHVICLSEHHFKTEALQGITVDNYNLGASYCRKLTKCGGVCIFLHKSCQFVKIDLTRHCNEQDIEMCAIRLALNPLNICVLSIYRYPSGNFGVFMRE